MAEEMQLAKCKHWIKIRKCLIISLVKELERGVEDFCYFEVKKSLIIYSNRQDNRDVTTVYKKYADARSTREKGNAKITLGVSYETL